MSNTTVPQRRCWFSQAEAAEYLGVGSRTIRNYISAGVLPAYRVQADKRGGRLVRIDRADLDRLLQPIPTVGTVGGGKDE